MKQTHIKIIDNVTIKIITGKITFATDEHGYTVEVLIYFL